MSFAISIIAGMLLQKKSGMGAGDLMQHLQSSLNNKRRAK